METQHLPWCRGLSGGGQTTCHGACGGGSVAAHRPPTWYALMGTHQTSRHTALLHEPGHGLPGQSRGLAAGQELNLPSHRALDLNW